MIDEATNERTLCYFRNLVSRAYREIRHIGTGNGSHQDYRTQSRTLAQLHERHAGYEGWPPWVLQDHRTTMAMTSVDKIVSEHQQRVGLSLPQILDVFRNGEWKTQYGGEKWAAIVERVIKLQQLISNEDWQNAATLAVVIAEMSHNTKKAKDDFIDSCG